MTKRLVPLLERIVGSPSRPMVEVDEIMSTPGGAIRLISSRHLSCVFWV
jgi:hypothetical protein